MKKHLSQVRKLSVLIATHAAAIVLFSLFLKLRCPREETSATSSLTDHTGCLVLDFRCLGRKHYNINGGCVWCESTPRLTVPPPVVMVVCPPNVLPSKRGFHPGRRGNSSRLFTLLSLHLRRVGEKGLWKSFSRLFRLMRCCMFVDAVCVCECVAASRLMYLQTFHSVRLWDHTACQRQTGFL